VHPFYHTGAESNRAVYSIPYCESKAWSAVLHKKQVDNPLFGGGYRQRLFRSYSETPSLVISPSSNVSTPWKSRRLAGGGFPVGGWQVVDFLSCHLTLKQKIHPTHIQLQIV
jgi:hypothetical protein